MMDVCTTRKDPGSEWLARDNPETSPTTIKPGSASHVAEWSTWVTLPNKTSCLVSTHFLPSSDNSLSSARQEPTLGPWKGSTFLQQSDKGGLLNSEKKRKEKNFCRTVLRHGPQTVASTLAGKNRHRVVQDISGQVSDESRPKGVCVRAKGGQGRGSPSSLGYLQASISYFWEPRTSC